MSLQDTYPCDCGQWVGLNNNYCPNCGDEIEIEWPLTFTTSATGRGNTSEMIESSGLPHSDEIIDALYHYPGEVRIKYELTQDLTVTPMEMEYEGKKWTPEESE